MNHIKGEWEQTGSIIWRAGKSGGVICQMAQYRPLSGMVEYHPLELSDPYWETQMANAHLIAAAPDMYEALKAILLNRELGEYESQKQGLPRMIEVNEKARQALAKAEGKE